MKKTYGFVGFIALLLVPVGLVAQRPSSVGSATALGASAVTEARRADAILWNPALLGIWDGPTSSYSLLSLDVRRMPNAVWWSEAEAFGLLGEGRYLPINSINDLIPFEGTADGFEGTVTWGAFQAKDFALAISSHGHSHATLTSDSLGRGSKRSVATVVAASKAGFFGPFPLIGAMWLGATAKGVWIHSAGRGGIGRDEFTIAGRPFSCEAANPLVCEARFRNVPGYGVDVGVAVEPVPGIKFGASVQNVVAGLIRPEDPVEVVNWQEGSVVDQVRVYDEADEGTFAYRLSESAWEELLPAAVVRGGASWRTSFGTIAGAVERDIRPGLGETVDGSGVGYSMSYQLPGIPLRASRSSAPGVERIEVGAVLGGCTQYGFAGGWENDEFAGRSYSVSLSATFAGEYCAR